MIRENIEIFLIEYQPKDDAEIKYKEEMPKFDGRIIFELAYEDKEVIDSIKRIKKTLQNQYNTI